MKEPPEQIKQKKGILRGISPIVALKTFSYRFQLDATQQQQSNALILLSIFL